MKSSQPHKVKRALISVSDKTGIVEFAQGLAQQGIEILSTGGTAKQLKAAHVEVHDVSDYTGFPELMGGRLKTLHPKIHGGILSRRAADKTDTDAHQISEIDLVVVSLYPFEQTIAKTHTSFAEAIENIDIGGPAMLRAAAKNHQFVTVIVDMNDYASVLDEIKHSGGVCDERRRELAAKAFAHTAQYDGTIAAYLSQAADSLPDFLTISAVKQQHLRYGENPHQQAAFYRQLDAVQCGISTAHQLQGKALSFNNLIDADTAFSCVCSFALPACVIVKHANPCGAAQKDTAVRAYEAAYRTDPTSAFGGVIAFNTIVDKSTAQAIIERQFVEVLIAADFDNEAKQLLAHKQNIRVLSCPVNAQMSAYELKQVNGALLMQTRDNGQINERNLQVVTQTAPTNEQMRDLRFAWHLVRYVKSNAIVYAKDETVIGIGAGQMSRVYSAKIAAMKAADEQLDIAGSVMASDAFFPFRDSIDMAAQAGIAAIIQPGGSIKDDEVIAACDEAGIAMVLTGVRHFRH